MAGLSTTFQPVGEARAAALIRSALDWWSDAGVDEALSETPTPWAGRAAAPSARRRPPAPEPTPAPRGAMAEASVTRRPADASAPSALPDTLPAFRDWLATAALPDLPPGGVRVVGVGAERAPVAVVVAQPMARDALLSASAHRLLEAMLRAVGLSLETVAVLPVLPSAMGPRLRDESAAGWRPIVARHLSLVGAERALLLGDGPCRTLLGGPAARARGRWHDVNHDGARLNTMASFDLTTLLDHPTCKGEAWADLLAFTRTPA